ncbi:MAG: hypothetical protein M5U09_09485 [Gammaproteobacteria bacterium]|nr:hypothetical protein [Gammaproteobacteria bacterium]
MAGAGGEERGDDGRSSGRTAARRSGKTVAIIVVFILAVFAWTIIGKMIR